MRTYSLVLLALIVPACATAYAQKKPQTQPEICDGGFCFKQTLCAPRQPEICDGGFCFQQTHSAPTAPELKVPSPNDPNFGDPLAAMMSVSAGAASEICDGGFCFKQTDAHDVLSSTTNSQTRPEKQTGASPGGTGGSAFRPGKDGVGYPSCVYCPEPQYSDAARNSNFQGIVVLQVIIQPDGHATNIQVVKDPGLGLTQKAIEAVRTWRFKPAIGPNGTPVATITPIEVNFRLLKK